MVGRRSAEPRAMLDRVSPYQEVGFHFSAAANRETSASISLT